jgi:hypothetical protein
MLGQGSSITLPQGPAFNILATVVSVGTLSCFALILAVVIGVSYLLILAVNAVCELMTHIAAVYSQADSLAKIIVWLLVALLLLKVSPWIAASLKRSLSSF